MQINDFYLNDHNVILNIEKVPYIEEICKESSADVIFFRSYYESEVGVFERVDGLDISMSNITSDCFFDLLSLVNNDGLSLPIFAAVRNSKLSPFEYIAENPDCSIDYSNFIIGNRLSYYNISYKALRYIGKKVSFTNAVPIFTNVTKASIKEDNKNVKVRKHLYLYCIKRFSSSMIIKNKYLNFGLRKVWRLNDYVHNIFGK